VGRRDVRAVHEQAEAAVALSTEQEFLQWAALGTIFRGWSLAMQGQGEEGLAQVRQGIAAWRATGAVVHIPYFCTVLADVCAHLGYTADGLQALAEARELLAPIYGWFTEGFDTADLQDAKVLLEVLA
jgi:predicted ATPase